MIEQFVNDVEWGALDYLIIDTPPGTGDEHLSAFQVLGSLDGAVIVTTPQGVSTMDAKRSAIFIRKLNSKVLGIVENMSYFVCPHCGERIYMFGEGGGEKLAEELGTDLIVKIPQNPVFVEYSEAGRPVSQYLRNTEIETVFKELAGHIIRKMEENG
jgi:ATP-binding protein involved in chromosome partitioning